MPSQSRFTQVTQKIKKSFDGEFKFYINQVHRNYPRIASQLSRAMCLGAVAAQSCMVGTPLFALGAVKLASQQTPRLDELGQKADKGIIHIANAWIGVNNWLIDHVLPTKDWRISLPPQLDEHKRYLLICNHQSWVDTSVIQYISQDRLPLTRFFAKQELLYIPVVGQAFYLLDFPMMKRPDKEKLAKNPSLLGRDLAEARRACQLLANKPFVLLNYLEGTRFSPQKHAKQHSPYRHLLKPKAGGFALAIASLGDKIDAILDMTIVYPDGVPDYDDLWAAKVNKIGVDIREVTMDERLFVALKQGGYQTDATTKQQLHEWLDELWQQKDATIEGLLEDFERA